MASFAMKYLKNKTKKDIERLAAGLEIGLSVEYQEIQATGWEGTAKVLMQILWERGFIDDTKSVSKYYTLTGKKDILLNIIPGTNICELMDNTSDFLHKVTLWIEVMRRLDITVHRLPKFHAQLAGEGIEYSWGFAKNVYCRLPILMKQTKDKFRASVTKVISRDELNKDKVRKFAHCAQGYLCAYH